MEIQWNLKGAIPRKVTDNLHCEKQIGVGSLTLSATPTIDSKLLIVLLREEGRPFGCFTTGYVPPYSLQNMQRGVMFDGVRLDPRQPSGGEALCEATVISLD